MRRKVQQIGGSLGVIIPRDIAEAMDVSAGDDVDLALVGRQLVVEPASDTMDKDTFRRAFKAVLRQYGPVFDRLAEYDRTGKR